MYYYYSIQILSNGQTAVGIGVAISFIVPFAKLQNLFHWNLERASAFPLSFDLTYLAKTLELHTRLSSTIILISTIQFLHCWTVNHVNHSLIVTEQNNLLVFEQSQPVQNSYSNPKQLKIFNTRLFSFTEILVPLAKSPFKSTVCSKSKFEISGSIWIHINHLGWQHGWLYEFPIKKQMVG